MADGARSSRPLGGDDQPPFCSISAVESGPREQRFGHGRPFGGLRRACSSSTSRSRRAKSSPCPRGAAADARARRRGPAARGDLEPRRQRDQVHAGRRRGAHRRAATVDGRPVVRVSDSGCGVPPQDRENIFRRFYRGERDGAAPGHGLGLSIADDHRQAARLQSDGGGQQSRRPFRAARRGQGVARLWRRDARNRRAARVDPRPEIASPRVKPKYNLVVDTLSADGITQLASAGRRVRSARPRRARSARAELPNPLARTLQCSQSSASPSAAPTPSSSWRC